MHKTLVTTAKTNKSKPSQNLFDQTTNKNITQKQLADIIGVKNYTVGNWEQGRANPNIGDLIAMANYFECSVDYLIGREDDFGNIVIVNNLSENQAKLLGLFSQLPQSKQKLVVELISDMYQANLNT